jgi:hypothetical protein
MARVRLILLTDNSYGTLQPFIVASQIMRLGMPFTMIYFVEYGGLIWPYFLLRLICAIFEWVSSLCTHHDCPY